MPSRDGGKMAGDGSCIKCVWNAANPYNKSKCQKGHASDCPQKNVYKQRHAKKAVEAVAVAKESQQQQELTLQAAAAEGT